MSSLRRGIRPARLWREFGRQGQKLSPRLVFWMKLCRAAGLINDNNTPTGFAHQWLAWGPEAQAHHILSAWQDAPKTARDRQFRKKLVWKFKYGKPLSAKDVQACQSLEILGFCRNGKLTAWGKVIISGDTQAPTLRATAPWFIRDENLQVPFPANWSLVWELERFLAPAAPGIYPLDRQALRQAVQAAPNKSSEESTADQLVHILEQGMAASIPPELSARIYGQPTVDVQTGHILIFSDPRELAELRRSSVLRKYLDNILSPRVVLVPWEDTDQTASRSAHRFLDLLKRRKVYTQPAIEERAPEKKRLRFRIPAPAPQPVLVPAGGPKPILEVLQEYIQLQQALDMFYHYPTVARPEKRRITPLLIETRGEKTYVIAYCHNRHGQRTFRLDRMEIPGTENELRSYSLLLSSGLNSQGNSYER